MTSYNKEKWICECPVCALSPPPIHPLSVYLLFHPLWLWYPINNNNNSCEKLFPLILCLLWQHQHSSVSAINIIVSSFFLTITAESTLPFLPSHISSPVTSPSPTSSSSSHCASSLSPRKLQLYPSCRQPLLVSRWTIHNFDPHSRTANAPYDDLLRSWHHQSPWIKIYWHHSKSYSFLAERPTEVKVSIFIRSMGPISEADMVSTYWYSETLTFTFHLHFLHSLMTHIFSCPQYYSMDCYFRQYWRDTRLSFQVSKHKI